MSLLSLKVLEVKEEHPGFKTYTFEHQLNAKPGQFVMVWLPGVDEVPMSIGWQTDSTFQMGIQLAGDCTQAIHERVKPGDRLGIRGPFGNPFNLKEYKNIVLVGGGCGSPPMVSVAQQAVKQGLDVTAILGARNAESLIYEDRFKALDCPLKIATDDGSKGHKGYCTDLLKTMLEKGGIDCVYTCGPELMMVKVAQLCREHNTDCQVSLERYMKCGFGICGQCCMDGSGVRVCKEGPVFSGETALELSEFGKYKRSASGRIKDL